MTQVNDVIQPVIQVSKELADALAAKLAAGGSLASLLPDIVAWLKANRQEWLPLLTPHSRGMNDTKFDFEKTLEGALRVSVKPVGDVSPQCMQCAHDDWCVLHRGRHRGGPLNGPGAAVGRHA